MRIDQARFIRSKGWTVPPGDLGDEALLVLAFGAPAILADRDRIRDIGRAYRRATVAGCSTAGEISGTEVTDDSMVVTALAPRHTRIQAVTLPLRSAEDSHAVGAEIAKGLASDDLVHVLVFSEGLHVNGSKLARGINEAVPKTTQVTGGLAGDGEQFDETLILADGVAGPERVTAIGNCAGCRGKSVHHRFGQSSCAPVGAIDRAA